MFARFASAIYDLRINRIPTFEGHSISLTATAIKVSRSNSRKRS
jgi:hypothetical protein